MCIRDRVNSVYQSILCLLNSENDLIIGSRFAKGSSISGLSKKRKSGSSFANSFAKFTLHRNYENISDFMSGCFVFKRNRCLCYLKKIDVNGFKFLYELLSISNGKLKIDELPLNFKPRKFGYSKLDLSLIHI